MYDRPRIIPCLLLKDQGLVKTIKFKTPNYLGDPINAVKIFNDKEIDELCILDIEASKQGRKPDFELLKNIAAEAFMPLSYGGGIKTIDEIKKIFRIGYEKVILNTSFIENPDIIKLSSEYAGSQSIVVSIDVKKRLMGDYRCVTKGGTTKLEITPFALAKKAQELGAGELLINSIDKDGTMQGYDIELIRRIVEIVSIPVIACGGASGLEDVKKVLHEGGAHAAAAGSMFVYYGRKKAVLINTPSEQELYERGIYKDE